MSEFQVLQALARIKTDLENLLKRSMSQEAFARVKSEFDVVTNAVTAALLSINDKSDVASLANMITTYVLVIGFFWEQWTTSGNWETVTEDNWETLI